MRSRWSIFGAGLIIYLWWYLVIYVVTLHTFAGLPAGVAYGLAAALGGLLVGAAIGVGAHAIDLAGAHREVRAGDARDGARVSLGKLPPIVPVVRRNDEASTGAPAEPATDPVSESLLPTDPDPAVGHGISDVADTGGTTMSEPVADAPNVPVPDRLAIECARFATEHDVVAVERSDVDGANVGTIDRTANPAEFGEFMALVSALLADGVNVSRVAVSIGPDGLPAVVAFPVSGEQK